MFVVTITDVVPTPRYDNKAWTTATMEESTSAAGPWTPIDGFPLSPIDTDPSRPGPRSFTTENATAPIGLWYRFIFSDLDGDQQQPTVPIQNMPEELAEYTPSLADVGAILRLRTRNSMGAELGTFTPDTVPKDAQVWEYIKHAMDDVQARIGTDVPDDMIEEARRLVALRTAMYIELTMFGEQVAQQRSPYRQIKELYDEKLPRLAKSVASVEAGLPIGNEPSTSIAQFGFPPPTGWIQGKM